MAKNIERVNYYEREYLQSYDLQAEQLYHMEMRRRLNLALHRWGIVDGLMLEEYKEFNVQHVRILPGMAIDAYGREVVLSSSYTLSEDDFRNNNIVMADATYSVWIAYGTSLENPPASGYRDCHIENQYTRWRETRQIIVQQENWPGPSQPEPKFYEELSDDPKKDSWPMFLGHIKFASGMPASITYDKTTQDRRRYIGLRAQQVIAPHNPVQTYDVLDKNVPKVPPTSLLIDTNAFANGNVIVGDDFKVDKTKVKPTPPATGFPNLNGNVKVGSDLFLNGNLYARMDSQGKTEWLVLKEYVQQFIPEIIVSTKVLPVDGKPAPDPSKDGIVVPHTSKLKNVSDAQCFTSIKRIKWKSVNEVKAYSAVVNGMGGIQPEISVYASKISGAAGVNTWSWKLTWELSPADRVTDVNNPKLPIEEIEVLYLVIFYP